MKEIQQAVHYLKKNQLVAIPTETVYGLAGNIFSEKAIKNIFELKNRPLFNPLIVHISSSDQMGWYAREIPEKAYQLASKFWPGPLTLLLKKKNNIPDIITAGKDTVALRLPNHKLTLKLLQNLDFPLAAPSANPFGSISPTNAQHVYDYFGEELPFILDGGPCTSGIESTIVGFENENPIVYRLGALSVEEIEEAIGPIRITNHKEVNPNAPGMLSKHYAPRTNTIVSDSIDAMIKKYERNKIGVITFSTQFDFPAVHQYEILSKSRNFKEASRNLYSAMHRLDRMKLDLILIEKLPHYDLGTSINDRLERASKRE
ncbi:L-threonylcarbamoyladenylate synthase [Flavobacterium aciduliphilum]|uniref:Threonylcarbamoyl-AMP synthase n=1 Tax=Flavobacterium aciduliphilum TaxID=1101402 RepID=A0A328YH67_9FLAO|nr:L-threonylcarbamoyladenylate synthase [Flavobacterium aciduliphilum]RAR70037.1 translation factor SUA5 [Flavobacterium aciduliphilum]